MTAFNRPLSPAEQAATTFARRMAAVWTVPYRRRVKRLALLATLLLLVLPGRYAYADNVITDTAKLQQAIQQVLDTGKFLCALAVPILILAGFAMLFGSGISDRWRARGPQILWGCALGALAVFFLVVPISNGILTIAGVTNIHFT